MSPLSARTPVAGAIDDLRARVAAYQEDYATVLAALGESFITEPTS